MSVCRNGHDRPAGTVGKCPECARLSHNRRQRRYYQKNKTRLAEAQRERRQARVKGWAA